MDMVNDSGASTSNGMSSDSYAATEADFSSNHDPLPSVNPNTLPDASASPSEMLARLFEKWFPGRAPGQVQWDFSENTSNLMLIFGLTPTQRIVPADINKKFKELSTEAATCLNGLDRSNELHVNNNDTVIRLILKKLEAAKQFLLGISMLCSADTMQPSDMPRDDYGLWRFIPMDATDDEPNPGQRLRMFALTDCMRLGYRRYRKSFMRRLITSEGYPTCAWCPDITIDDYVRTLTNRRLTDPQVWFDMTAGAGWSPAKQLAEYLVHSDDPEIPWLEPDRHVFSFVNGAYMTKDEIFIPYDRMHLYYAHGSYPIAAKHFDMMFDPQWLLTPDPIDIPTPAIDDVFNTQELSPDVRRWCFALFGRLLYNVGEIDDWQIFPFIKGLAGTGKSVLLNHIKRIYDAQDVGVISNMIEKQFGFSQVAGKFIGVADDVRSTFQLDQSDFQNACSGNAVSVAVKFKDAMIVDPWETGLILSGNEVPGYHDNSGSFGRRLAVILFSKMVDAPDGSMSQKLYDEMAAFLAKCNRQYRNMMRRCGNRGIWTVLPQEFKIQRAELTATSNALVGFLSSGILNKEASLYMPIDEMRDAVMNYAVRNNLEKPHWGPDYYRGPITQDHLIMRSIITRRYYPRYQRKHRVRAMFVDGCDLAVRCEAANENGADALQQMDYIPNANGKRTIP